MLIQKCGASPPVRSNMIESIRLGISSRAASAGSFVRATLVALTYVPYPACHFKLGTTPSQSRTNLESQDDWNCRWQA
eukprot:1461736-Pyramimonas_sp.AAC.1